MNGNPFSSNLSGNFAFSMLGNGFPRGALGVLCGKEGSGKSEVVCRFLAENTSLKTAWIEDSLTVYPAALEQKGVALDRVLFVEGADQSLWCMHQILRSHLFQVVVHTVRPRRLRKRELALNEDEVSLRRLQIAAEKAGALVLFLSEAPFPASWPLAVQIEVSRFFPHTTHVGVPAVAVPVEVEIAFNILKYRGQRVWKTSPNVLKASPAF